MGKKGNWISALKKTLNHYSKFTNVCEKKNGDRGKKRWRIGWMKRDKRLSFQSLNKETSIENTLHYVESGPNRISFSMDRSNLQQTSAAKIQAAYRSHLARRDYRALKALLRLQNVVRGSSARRQTISALRCFQRFVRVQSQRIHGVELRSMQCKNLKEYDLNSTGELDIQEWDDTRLTKEDRDARMNRKMEAMVKRERAKEFAAYSYQIWNRGSHMIDCRFPRGGDHLQTIKTRDCNHPSAAKSKSNLGDSDVNKNFKYSENREMLVSTARWMKSPSSLRESVTSLQSTRTSKPGRYEGTLPNYMVATASTRAKAKSPYNPKQMFAGESSRYETKRSPISPYIFCNKISWTPDKEFPPQRTGIKYRAWSSSTGKVGK